MRINRFWAYNKLAFLMAAGMIFVLIATGPGESAETPQDTIVASGDDFVLTQERVDAYGALIASRNQSWPPAEIVSSALKYELLSREYRKNRKPLAEDSEGVEQKIADGSKYIQKMLDDWVVASPVIESYYRANPEKYKAGTASDGRFIVVPLDDALKEEIRFMIIESKKDVIVKEIVDSLIRKYHIKLK